MRFCVLIVSLTALVAGPYAASGEGAWLDLPEPALKGMPVEEAISARRSVRFYSPDSLTIPELSQLVFAAQGITARRGEIGLRAAPSAGATYPIEVYIVVNRVSGLDPGIYHYAPGRHAIELIKQGFFGMELSLACLGQSMPEKAAVSMVLTAVPERTCERYGERGIRYVHMEAGHVSQNICLQATSLGLGAVPVGAFEDEAMNALIGIDGTREIALYVNPIGRLIIERGEEE